MNRYVTVETYGGNIHAFTEQDDYKGAINDDDTADWIWQFAESKEQAIAQHQAKQDLWSADMDAGRPERPTY